MDLAIIRETFATALREKGYRRLTIDTYLRVLCRAARFLAREEGSLAELQREDVPDLLRRLLRRRHDRHYYETCCSPLHAWLKFHGRFAKSIPRLPWQSWLDDYAQFLTDVRGLAPITRTGYVSCACAFMDWQFGKKQAHRSRVLATDIWRYGERCAGAKRHKPSYVNRQLSALRQFLSFVHLQGACSAQLRYAVPRSKFSPQRVLPLHPTTVRALQRYREIRLRTYPLTNRFFAGQKGRPLQPVMLDWTLRQLTRGITPNGDRPTVRLVDLRHAFATRLIAQWSRQRQPVSHHLLLLARYLGHQNFRSTWWYVSREPDSLAAASARFQRYHTGREPTRS